MNRAWVFIWVVTVLLVTSAMSTTAYAQIESETDTIRVEDVYGNAGDSVAVQLYLANSIDVGGLNFILRFDSTYLAPGYNWQAINNPTQPDTTKPMNFQMINRGANKFFYTQSVNSADTVSGRHYVTGVFVGDPFSDDDIAVGSGTFVQFWVHIKPNAIEGDSVMVQLFNETVSGGRQNEFYDPDGLVGVNPTLVAGYVHVGEGGPTPSNDPPYFTGPTQTVFNVDQGQLVEFTVSASDPDVGQPITLRMLSGPSGSSFPVTLGANSVSAVFSWTPNFSQTGNFSATFEVSDDSNATSQRVVTIQVEAPTVEDDFLYTTSQSAYQITGGIPGANDVAAPVNLNDLNTLYGIQFKFSYDYTVMRLDSVAPTDRLEGFEVYTKNHGSGLWEVVTFGLGNETIQGPVTSNAIFNCWFTMNTTAVSGWYRFKLQDGRASISPDPGVASVDILVDTLGMIAVDAFGDVNLDTIVDVGDLVSVVGYIIGDYSLNTRQFRAGDINSDLECNVVDLVGIMNLIFDDMSPVYVPKGLFAGGSATVDLVVSEEPVGGYGALAVEADLPTDVAGMQFDLRYNSYDVELGQPQLTDLSRGMKLEYRDDSEGRMTVLVYFDPSNRDDVVSEGLGELVTIPVYEIGTADLSGGTSVRLEETVLSDPYGQEISVLNKGGQLPTSFSLRQNYPNPFNPETRISFSINGQETQSVELSVYNILGQKVSTLLSSNLAPGEYDVSWDGTSSSGEKQASGIYFYTLTVGDRRDTRKMVLTK